MKVNVLQCTKCNASMILFLGTKICTKCPHEEESGKVQFAMIPIVPVFKVDDGERHWIAAKDVDEVRKAYNAIYGEELEECAVIEPVTLDVLRDPFITTEEGRKVSLIEIIRDQNEFPALLASSVW